MDNELHFSARKNEAPVGPVDAAAAVECVQFASRLERQPTYIHLIIYGLWVRYTRVVVVVFVVVAVLLLIVERPWAVRMRNEACFIVVSPFRNTPYSFP